MPSLLSLYVLLKEQRGGVSAADSADIGATRSFFESSLPSHSYRSMLCAEAATYLEYAATTNFAL